MLTKIANTFKNITHAAVEYARTLSHREAAGDRGVMEDVQVLQTWLIVMLIPTIVAHYTASEGAAMTGPAEDRAARAQLQAAAQAALMLALFLEHHIKRLHLVRGYMLQDPATALPRAHICTAYSSQAQNPPSHLATQATQPDQARFIYTQC